MQPTRSIIRKKYGLEEAPHSDCISTTVLCCFAICQETAELEVCCLNPKVLDLGSEVYFRIWRSDKSW